LRHFGQSVEHLAGEVSAAKDVRRLSLVRNMLAEKTLRQSGNSAGGDEANLPARPYHHGGVRQFRGSRSRSSLPRKAWFVQIAGKQVNLGPDREAALCRDHERVGQP
jgi:hypothetical protein